MADIHDKKTRRYNMSRIRGREDRVAKGKRGIKRGIMSGK